MRHIRIERATLLAGVHAETGSIHQVDTDTADLLVRHGIATESDGKAAPAKLTAAEKAAAKAEADAAAKAEAPAKADAEKAAKAA